MLKKSFFALSFSKAVRWPLEPDEWIVLFFLVFFMYCHFSSPSLVICEKWTSLWAIYQRWLSYVFWKDTKAIRYTQSRAQPKYTHNTISHTFCVGMLYAAMGNSSVFRGEKRSEFIRQQQQQQIRAVYKSKAEECQLLQRKVNKTSEHFWLVRLRRTIEIVLGNIANYGYSMCRSTVHFPTRYYTVLI